MTIESHHRLRQNVHVAVARAGRLREDGRDDAADAHLARRLGYVRKRLAESGVDDAAAIVQGWVEEDRLAFAHGFLVREFFLDRMPPVNTGWVSRAFTPQSVAAPSMAGR